jgi:hypothetical protein
MNIPKTIALYASSSLFISTLLTTPTIAHLVQISGDVGATLHIEPNDNPRAGEPSLAWFALTRQGGELIPLEACNCQLEIYTQPGNAIVQSPTLEPVSAEGYRGIPGAEVTFPQVGAYDLVLQGEPTTPEDFQPFEFRFSVTVAAGQVAPSPQANAASEQSSPSTPISEPTSEPTTNPTFDVEAEPNPQTETSWITGLVIFAIALIGATIALWQYKTNPKQKR